jgi:hypothetical protein
MEGAPAALQILRERHDALLRKVEERGRKLALEVLRSGRRRESGSNKVLYWSGKILVPVSLDAKRRLNSQGCLPPRVEKRLAALTEEAILHEDEAIRISQLTAIDPHIRKRYRAVAARYEARRRTGEFVEIDTAVWGNKVISPRAIPNPDTTEDAEIQQFAETDRRTIRLSLLRDVLLGQSTLSPKIARLTLDRLIPWVHNAVRPERASTTNLTEIQLGRNAARILKYLSKQSRARTQVDMIAVGESGIKTRKTTRPALKELEGLGLAKTPAGERSGYVITTQGREWLRVHERTQPPKT